jgi:hypothetical protein
MQIPEGWKLVPINPTKEMLDTQGKSRPDLAKTDSTKRLAEMLNDEMRKYALEIWSEMIAVSPDFKESN